MGFPAQPPPSVRSSRAAIVGTTIAPWQLFFQPSCIADKRLRFSDVKWARLDTFLGAVLTIIVAECMMLAGNAAGVHGIPFFDPAQMKRLLYGKSPQRSTCPDA